MSTLLFVLEIGEVRLGALYEHLPLHCTLVPWVEFPPDFPARCIAPYVELVCARYAPITLVSVGSASNFGPSEKTFVHLVHKDAKLLALHNELLRVCASLGGTAQTPAWTGETYQPHVTPRGEDAFWIGRRHVARMVYVAQQVPETEEYPRAKQIIARCALSGPSM